MFTEDEVMENKKSLFTVKGVLRALTAICIVFVFCPSFLVSCSGRTFDINVLTVAGGMESYGETVVEPHPIVLICLLIPVVSLVFLFLKKLSEKKTAFVVMACAIVDVIVWFVFRSSVKKFAEENYCEFKTTAWFVINIIVLLIIVLMTAMVVIGKLELGTDLLAKISGTNTKEVLNQMSEKMNQMSGAINNMVDSVNSKKDVIGYCSKCGNAIEYGNKFCIKCGTEVPKNLIEAAEEARREAEEALEKEELEENKTACCKNCGAELPDGVKFCQSCGTKVEEV